MSVMILLLFIPFVIVATAGLLRLFLAPLVTAFDQSPPRATQYFITDVLLFLLLFGTFASVLVAITDDRESRLILMGFLLVLLGLMWVGGCHVLSRLQVQAFWPRAVGLTCVSAAMVSALGLALTLAPAALVALRESVLPLMVWCVGLPLSLTLSRLGVAYVLRAAKQGAPD